MMKKVMLFLGLAALLAMASCKRDTVCRCSVIGDNAVRYFTIDKGHCEDIRFLYSNHDNIHTRITDTVVCTGYDFNIEES